MDEQQWNGEAKARDRHPELPPHAPARRQIHEEPLATAERLVTDELSKHDDEQTWELYSQVEDEVALAHADLTLESRLAAAVGRSVRLELLCSHSSQGESFVGVIQQVGAGWVALAVGSRSVIVNTTAVASISAESDRLELLPLPDAATPGRASWASALRNAGAAGHTLVVHRVVGGPLSGNLVRAAADHLELGCHHSVADPRIRESIVVPYRAVMRIELR